MSEKQKWHLRYEWRSPNKFLGAFFALQAAGLNKGICTKSMKI